MTQLSRRAVAVAAGGVVGSLIVASCAVGLLRGPAAWAVFVAALLALPSSPSLSRRIARNIAVTLGVIPMLWWCPWPLGGIGRAALVAGMCGGALVAILLWSPATRASVVPRFRVTDAIIALPVVVSSVMFAPFFARATGQASVSILLSATGGDNLAHFDIFEMIRRSGVAVMWPRDVSGSAWTSSTYPQHFHSFAAFGAELWAGPGVTGIEDEVGIYGMALSFAMSLGSIAVISALVSLTPLRERFALALPAAAAVVSLLVVWLGAELLSFGFPNFVLGVYASALGLLLASSPRTRFISFAAIACTVIVAAHTWAPLAGFAGVGLVLAGARLPLDELRRHRALRVGVLLVAAAVLAGTVYAGVLVILATSGGHHTLELLGSPGDIPPNPVWVTFSVLVGVLVIGTLLVRRYLTAHVPRPADVAVGSVALGASVTAVLMSIVLIAIQLGSHTRLGYYQFKFLDGALMIVAAVGAVTLVQLVDGLGVLASINFPLRVATVGVTALGLFLVAGAPTKLGDQAVLPVVAYRDGLASAAKSDPRVLTLLSAARTMSDRPCRRPIYLSDFGGGQVAALENTRAMALSSTWTIDGAGVSSQLAALGKRSTADPPTTAVIADLLKRHPDRCVIVSPAMMAVLAGAESGTPPARVVTWVAVG